MRCARRSSLSAAKASRHPCAATRWWDCGLDKSAGTPTKPRQGMRRSGACICLSGDWAVLKGSQPRLQAPQPSRKNSGH
eukprot:15430130-Alexandrium_andersonii.AAC.1